MRYGPIGTEFTATMLMDNELSINEVVPEEETNWGLQVVGFDGRTCVGNALWYRFRVVEIAA